jgi:hypothetical protein
MRRRATAKWNNATTDNSFLRLFEGEGLSVIVGAGAGSPPSPELVACQHVFLRGMTSV